MTPIRTFTHGQHHYRHAIDLNTDDVLLQRLNLEAETPEDEWRSLLRYDPHCGVWDASTGKRLGAFRTVGGHWVFMPAPPERPTSSKPANGVEFFICEHERAIEGLLDSEVTISKRWLAAQQTTHHTPGRLQAFTQYAEPELRDEAGNLVAVVHRYAHANAIRLAACWNACQGLSTSALEAGPTAQEAYQREERRADQAETERDELRAQVQDDNNEILSLRAERDELLVALQAIKANAGNPERVYQLTRAAPIITAPRRTGLATLALSAHQRDEAVRHLHAILNSQRTATQALEAERAAREWLESIGSEAP